MSVKSTPRCRSRRSPQRDPACRGLNHRRPRPAGDQLVRRRGHRRRRPGSSVWSVPGAVAGQRRSSVPVGCSCVGWALDPRGRVAWSRIHVFCVRERAAPGSSPSLRHLVSQTADIWYRKCPADGIVRRPAGAVIAHRRGGRPVRMRSMWVLPCLGAGVPATAGWDARSRPPAVRRPSHRTGWCHTPLSEWGHE